MYKKDIPIYPEEDLPLLIKKFKVDEVVFAYSDVTNEYVMQMASVVQAYGADFKLLGPDSTMIKSKKPVIAVCAVRTGAGKSPTARKIIEILKSKGLKPVLVRHAMPYSNLRKQIVQRFETIKDLKKHKCTIEEMEEYEQHIKKGVVVYAGVDYERIIRKAEKEADIIIFDGGNNDFSFFKPDLLIVIADARRPGHEIRYYPGEINFRMADVIVINKVRTSDREAIGIIEKNIELVNPDAIVIKADMPKSVRNPKDIKGKTVLAVDDGPTLTHGGLSYGAGYLAAKEFKAKRIIDPRPYLRGSYKETFKKYRHIGHVLPALGYGEKQINEMEKIINRIDCEVVVSGTPINLKHVLKINKPIVRVEYNFQQLSGKKLEKIISQFIKKNVKKEKK